MIRARNSTGPDQGSRFAFWGCVLLSIAGALTTLGCLLAIYLEASGFGAAPRDGVVRPAYTTALIAGAIAGILVPAAVCFALLRSSRRRLIVVVAVSAVIILALAIMGIINT